MLKERIGAIFILALILLSVFVPYYFLSDVYSVYGSFLFWVGATIVVIIANHFITKDWGK